MLDLNPEVQIITLGVNRTNTSVKSRDWQTGQKYKIQLYAIYKWPILSIKIQIG